MHTQHVVEVHNVAHALARPANVPWWEERHSWAEAVPQHAELVAGEEEFTGLRNRHETADDRNRERGWCLCGDMGGDQTLTCVWAARRRIITPLSPTRLLTRRDGDCL